MSEENADVWDVITEEEATSESVRSLLARRSTERAWARMQPEPEPEAKEEPSPLSKLLREKKREKQKRRNFR